jgi:hypothetical protein
MGGMKRMDGFTLLAFALCARVVMGMGQDLVELGQVVAGECDTHYLFGDSGGDTAPIYGHDIGVAIFDDGAEVSVDGRMFIVPKMMKV